MVDPLGSGGEGFSADIARANAVLHSSSHKRYEKVQALQRWCRDRFGYRRQEGATKQIYSLTCSFGRGDANELDNTRLFTLLLDESEIVQLTDSDLIDLIQLYRRAWKRLALHGGTSAFLIAIVGERLARVKPGPELMEICRRLMSMYLLVQISPDKTYYDEESLYLKIRTTEGILFKEFNALSNIFAVQGDLRWWHDHRAPGGILISTNSPGHYAHRTMGLSHAGGLETEALQRMLDGAMGIIRDAYKDESGRYSPTPATWLVTEGAVESKSRYGGYYHTDHPIPSVYFDPRASRVPSELSAYSDLDFTYMSDAASRYHRSLVLGTEATRQEIAHHVLPVPDFEFEADFPAPKKVALMRFLEVELAKRMRRSPDPQNWMNYYIPQAASDVQARA